MSGSAPFRLSLFHYYEGVVSGSTPFQLSLFPFLLGCSSGSTCFWLSLFHFLLWCPSGFAYSPLSIVITFSFPTGVGFATLLIIIIIITKGMSSNQTLLTRMGKKQTLLPGLLLTIVSACMRRLWLILLLLSILEMFVVFILIFTNYLILDLVCLCAIHVHKPSSKVFFF
jgi:hypothetical protein